MRYWFLPALLILLGLLSVLTLSSIAPALASRQLLFFVVGGVSFITLSRLSWKRILQLSVFGYGITIALLILTLAISLQTRNTARWIDVGGLFALQASQLAIPLVGLYISSLIGKTKYITVKNMVYWAFLIAVPAGLILIEPDLGTTIVYLASLAPLALFLPISGKQILSMLGIGLATVAIAWVFVFQPYQKQRITSFIDPTADLTGASYNANQSMIAVGSGQFWGRGLGQGVQSHLRFLPERQTDFIFSSIAEEFGFVGSMLVISLYLGLVLFLLHTARTTKEKTVVYFVYVVTAQILLQSFVNMGMNMGLLPITGITLPLLSYGGSSVITVSATLGLLQADIRTQRKELTLHVS
ncbi:MAG: rod shape-determining protein RodA [Pseudomonadales bacterium]|nr:rod shape-determining protein RodA [Candidatus Woesebacteria bacterium]MCB9800756.1 rod shape-determining protein RodA [Pseudomonadales bacterium]